MIIKAMSPRQAEEWFDFFDNRAFADHEDWKGCYCTHFFMPRLPDYAGGTRRRDYARWLVETGRMKGYLAYERGKVIAWCNVNDRSAYPRLGIPAEEGEGVRSVTCFIVEKSYRGMGVAQKLLDRVIKDAKREGVRVVEAYPRKRASTEFGQFRGPYAMYEKNGFVPGRLGKLDLVRRHL